MPKAERLSKQSFEGNCEIQSRALPSDIPANRKGVYLLNRKQSAKQCFLSKTRKRSPQLFSCSFVQRCGAENIYVNGTWTKRTQDLPRMGEFRWNRGIASPISLQSILLKVVYTTGKLGTDPSRKECGPYKFARLNCSYHVFEMGKDLWFLTVWCQRSAPNFCCGVTAF